MSIMNNAAKPILDLLSEAQRKRDAAIDRAERAKIEADKFAAEAAAYQRALEAMGFSDKAAATSGAASPTGISKRPRLPSKKWIDIYTALYLSAEVPYDYQAIMAASETAGHSISEGSMRTQMMNAVNSGIFERIDAGKFKFTDKGLEAIDASPNENSGSAEPPEDKTQRGGIPPGLHNPNPAIDGA